MKRNSMRLLSLALTLVMLLGAVPFAAATAAEPEVTILADPGNKVWSGTEVNLVLTASAGTLTNVSWYEGGTPLTTGDQVTVTPTKTTTYKVEYELGGKTGSDTETITVWQRSDSTFAITTTTAIKGEKTKLEVTGAGDSQLVWEVKKGSTVVATTDEFTPAEAGDYAVKVTAKNDTEDTSDDKTATGTITVTAPTYTVTLGEDKTLAVNTKSATLPYTVKKGSATVTNAGETNVTYTSSDTTVASVSNAGALTLYKAGWTDITVNMTIDGKPVHDTVKITVTDTGVITMDQDGKMFDHDDDAIDLDFYVTGPTSTEKVSWTFEVYGLSDSDSKSSPCFSWKDTSKSDKRKYDTSDKGTDIKNVELTVNKTGLVARIDAYAYWGDNESAEGTFFIAVANDDTDIIVTLKKNVDEFDWDEKDQFSAVKVDGKSYSNTQLTKANLADLLALDTDEGYIELDEGSDYRDNEDVGKITSSSSVYDYDKKNENTYAMEDLDQLTFEVEDDGVFALDFIQYEIIEGYYQSFILGEGTLQIEVGDGKATTKKGDINYEVKNKGEVALDEDDFESFWDDYCEEEDVSSSDDDFGYVIFDGYNTSKIKGAMYGEGGSKTMKNNLKFHYEYSKSSDSGYDLDEVTYKASSTVSNYVDEIDFTCYNDNGKKICDGSVSFTVGNPEDGEKTTTTTGTMNFKDVKTSDWFYNAVEYVYTNGIMNGYDTNNNFAPNKTLERSMVVTMLYRVEKEPTVSTTKKFSDVKSSDWYYNAVLWAAHNGIVTGYEDGTFAPGKNISRQELAVILYRYADYKNMDTAATKTLTGYPDASSVADYATTAMKWAITKGIISGTNTGHLNPTGTATRAEAATMFQRFLSAS